MLIIKKIRDEKFLILLWVLIPALIISISSYGFFIGDVMGGVLLSFLPAAFITVISVAAALFAKKSVFKLARYVWLTVNLTALLVATLSANRPIADAVEGAETLLAYAMLILSFPFGLLVPYVIMINFFVLKNSSGIASLCGMWFGFFMVGYIQWFLLFPLIINKIRPR